MPADARIHFVRHAETLFNVNGQLQGWCDSPLTERGEHQVKTLGERMRNVPLGAAFVSDLTRTRTTMAGALSGHPGLVATPMTELREWHFGSWEGQPNASLWAPVFSRLGFTYAPGSADWPTLTENGFDAVLDGIYAHDPLHRAETANDINTRLERGLGVIVAAAVEAAESGAGDVIVVTHGAVLGTILRQLDPGYRPRAGFPNCGIVTVTARNGRFVVGEVDDSCARPELTAPVGNSTGGL
ncbi:MAG: Phosphoglycerate mutase [Glaciihabitans sp.]|nr:Phosphoglycerate mutase [Glaciihabitans sp.]